MADRFCLLDLNDVCVKTVLQCFDVFDLISFSLCSKKRLRNVRSLKLHIEDPHLFCDETFYALFNFKGNVIKLLFCGNDKPLDEKNNTQRKLQVDYIEGCYRFEHLHRQDGNRKPPIRRWRKSNFRGNDWLRHFMDVINSDKIHSLLVLESKFEVDSLVDIVQNLSIVSFTTNHVTKPYILSLLKAQPCLENLSVDWLTFDEPSEYSVLLRNQQKLTIQEGAKIKLDIVLSVNSLAFECSGLPIKDVNRFIKLWKEGANPRLRCLCVRYYANPAGEAVLNENEVLRGVQCKRMPPRTVRMFEVAAYRMEIDGGFDIVGKSGRKATVTLEDRAVYSIFCMFIWQ